MKNKKLIYVFLPLALIVWGLVFYKIFTYTGAKENKRLGTSTSNIKLLNKDGDVDTFSIQCNYRDPFLQTVIGSIHTSGVSRKSSTVIKNKILPETKHNESKPLIWPALKYGGVMKNTQSKKLVCILKINNTSELMKEGDVKAEVKVVKIYADSIIVSYANQRKTISRISTSKKNIETNYYDKYN